MTTKAQAITHAAATVRMVSVARGSYEVQTYDAQRNAWIASNATDYHRARAALSAGRVRAAAIALGYSTYDADGIANDYGGGDWRAYVRNLA